MRAWASCPAGVAPASGASCEGQWRRPTRSGRAAATAATSASNAASVCPASPYGTSTRRLANPASRACATSRATSSRCRDGAAPAPASAAMLIPTRLKPSAAQSRSGAEARSSGSRVIARSMSAARSAWKWRRRLASNSATWATLIQRVIPGARLTWTTSRSRSNRLPTSPTSRTSRSRYASARLPSAPRGRLSGWQKLLR